MISPESYWDALHEMPEGIRDCLKNAQLTEKEYRRLCPAMDRLWNAFGIRCLGRYYSTIKQVLPAEKQKEYGRLFVLLFTRLAPQGIVCYTL